MGNRILTRLGKLTTPRNYVSRASMSPLAPLIAIFLMFPEGKILGVDVAADNAYAAFIAAWMQEPIAFKGMDHADRVLATSKLAIVFGYHEGRGRTDPPHDVDPLACGVMQPHLPPARCAHARTSLLAGYEEGIRELVAHVRRCAPGKDALTPADVVRGLGSYGTGKCGGWVGGATARARTAGIIP
jgi:hypothetical protein